jgi:2,3-dihydroxybenzoate decarboxylase
LLDAILELGAERILFSTDYPFDDVGDTAQWFDALPVSEADLKKMGPRQRSAAVQVEAEPGLL